MSRKIKKRARGSVANRAAVGDIAHVLRQARANGLSEAQTMELAEKITDRKAEHIELTGDRMLVSEEGNPMVALSDGTMVRMESNTPVRTNKIADARRRRLATQSELEAAIGGTVNQREARPRTNADEHRAAVTEWLKIAEQHTKHGDEHAANSAYRMATAEQLMPEYSHLLHQLRPDVATWHVEPGEQALATWIWLRSQVAKIKSLDTDHPAQLRARVSSTDNGVAQWEATSADDAIHARMWTPLIDQARVVAIECGTPVTLAYEVDKRIHEIAGIELIEAGPEHFAAVKDPTTPGDHARWLETMAALIKPDRTMPRTPFPVTAYVYGVGWRISHGDVVMRGGNNAIVDDELGGLGIVLAHIVDEERGDVWDISIIENETDGDSGLHVWRMREAGVWKVAACRAQIPLVFDAIITSSHGPLKQLPTLGSRRRQEKAGAVVGLRGPPMPYYTVRANASVPHIEPPARTHASPSFRFDVMGHDRLYVHRGELPLDDTAAQRLVRRGYVLSLVTDAAQLSGGGGWPRLEGDNEGGMDLGGAIARAARRRGHADPHVGEWIAVRLVRVKSHQKGPEGGPYVPAVREPAIIKESQQ